jgi:hypothetical protein
MHVYNVIRAHDPKFTNVSRYEMLSDSCDHSILWGPEPPPHGFENGYAFVIGKEGRDPVFLDNMLSWPIFKLESLQMVFGDIVSHSDFTLYPAQLLDATNRLWVRASHYRIMHIRAFVPALDMERSQFRMWSVGKGIQSISKWVLSRKRLRDCPALFRVTEYPFTFFMREDVVRRFASLSDLGFEWKEMQVL